MKKISRRSFLASVAAVSTVGVLAACGGSDSKSASSTVTSTTASTSAVPTADTVKLVYAEVNPDDSLMGRTAAYFKEQVEELSGGSVTVDVQASGVMGDEATVLDAMISGANTVDVTRISAFSMTSYGCGLAALCSCPYLFSSRDHFWKFAASDVGQEVLSEGAEKAVGVSGLFFAEEGFRNFFFTKRVSDIADLKGMKLRVSTDPTMVKMVEGLGASATSINFSELYSSLSSHVVDGAEQPIANYQSNTFYEVCPYMILDQHTLGACMVVVADTARAKLTDEQFAAVQEAGKKASEFNAKESASNEENCKKELEAAGVVFTSVENLEPWREACADAIAYVSNGMESYVEKIQALDQ